MSVPLKYAVIERERRYLLASVPTGVTSAVDIVDRYLIGTRLRLREVRHAAGQVVYKLGHKVRLAAGPGEIACTNLYLDEKEWSVLVALPSRTLRKRRHIVVRDGWRVAVDVHQDGTILAEIDDADGPSNRVPDWLDVIRDVSSDEAWTGAALAQ